MSYADNLFIDNVNRVFREGYWDTDEEVRPRWKDGTPAHTAKIFGVVNRYDLSKEFPILTIRKQNFDAAVDEILWIYQKKSSELSELDSHIWDAWDIGDGTIGKAYGYQIGEIYAHHKTTDEEREKYQWTDEYPSMIMSTDGYTYLDQMDGVLWDLKHNPASRRMVISMYNHKELHEMGLYPCAWSLTFNTTGGVLNMILMQRSQDMLIAHGWNIMQYAALQMMVARATGFPVGEFIQVISDCHIYDRHMEIIKDVIRNEPYPAPKVHLNPKVTNFYEFIPEDFWLEDYKYWPAVKAEVAI